jgi:pimeloyl-ACP methyl ester carboxylesterase
VQAFYGQPQKYSYWNGCSTGGRQGLRMAQDYPDDYDGILAGAPAIHWDRFQAGHAWYAMVQLRDNGGPIGGGEPSVLGAKERLATAKPLQHVCRTGYRTMLEDHCACKYRASRPLDLKADCRVSDGACPSLPRRPRSTRCGGERWRAR